MPRQTNMKLSPVGILIDAVRNKRDIALTQLALTAQLHYTQLYRIMHGLSNPSRDSLLRICRALKCTPVEATEIFNQTEYRAPSQDELEEERPVHAA